MKYASSIEMIHQDTRENYILYFEIFTLKTSYS